ncbi:unnamed protein product, partial [Enterobius vermicularis]|uniref:CXC domain-containing protein n=1 Tax=Enterobius vermicularis TaxID=51028 RepID=A0A0N4VQT5_ENTVE
MLLGACNCSITPERIRKNNCSCCTDCIKCLDKQYTQCCSCVGLCNTDKEPPRMNSYVDNLDQDEEALIVFDKVALVNKVGTTYSFPVFKEFRGDMKRMRETQRVRNVRPDMSCTVVYLDKCLSHDQCSRQCLVSYLVQRCYDGFILAAVNVSVIRVYPTALTLQDADIAKILMKFHGHIMN